MVAMTFLEALHADSIQLNMKARTKEEAVRELAELLFQAHRIPDKESVIGAVMAREAAISTGIGEGVAVLHSKIDSMKEMVAAVGISQEGIDWQSLDGRPAHIVILVLSPLQDAGAQSRL